MAVLAVTLAGLASCGGSGSSAGSPEEQQAIDEIVDVEPEPTTIRLLGNGTFVDVVAAEGAVLTTTGPDGTSYELDVPPNVLPYDTVLSLTPAEGEGIVGVAIEPDGLMLNDVATLTLTPPDGAEPGRALWWDGFGVVGPAIAPTTASNEMIFLLAHFSGYGHGTAPGTGPAPTPLDDWAATTAQYTGEAALGGEMSDVDMQILEDQAEAVWSSYVKPLLERGVKTCGAHRALQETMRFVVITQSLGLDIGDVASDEMHKKAVDAYGSMKKCAKQECEAGNVDAAAMMLRAVNVAQHFGVEEAIEEGMAIFQEVLGTGMSSPWVKCRILTMSMHVKGTTTGTFFGATPTTVVSQAMALGRLDPGPDGQTGEVGMWLTGTGYDDGTELSGFFSVFMGQAPMDGLTSCTGGSFPRGYVEAKVTWDDDNLPTLEFSPMVSKVSVKCAKLDPVLSPFGGFYFAGVPASVAAGEAVRSLTHRFTAAEAWPTSSGAGGRLVALGYRWRETTDLAPLFRQQGINFYSVAETQFDVKIGLGSANSPVIPSPGPSGLVNGLSLD